MRYTLTVRADHKDQVEAIISKLPSHYEKVHLVVDESMKPPTLAFYLAPVEGSTEALMPVGQLATLTAVAHEEGTKPTHYTLSGEFNKEQLKALKDALGRTELVYEESVT